MARLLLRIARGLLCRYPYFTMAGQSLGSVFLAWECLWRCNPDIFVDTTGYAFTFIVAKLLAACRVVCYVHYPTITGVSAPPIRASCERGRLFVCSDDALAA